MQICMQRMLWYVDNNIKSINIQTKHFKEIFFDHFILAQFDEMMNFNIIYYNHQFILGTYHSISTIYYFIISTSILMFTECNLENYITDME